MTVYATRKVLSGGCMENLNPKTGSVNLKSVKMTGKFEIIRNAVIKAHPERKSGGQTVGMPSRGVSLRSSEANFYIEIDGCRIQYQNRELALTLFELYLDETIF